MSNAKVKAKAKPAPKKDKVEKRAMKIRLKTGVSGGALSGGPAALLPVHL